jgi:hypothetical protein
LGSHRGLPLHSELQTPLVVLNYLKRGTRPHNDRCIYSRYRKKTGGNNNQAERE